MITMVWLRDKAGNWTALKPHHMLWHTDPGLWPAIRHALATLALVVVTSAAAAAPFTSLGI